MFAVTLLCSPRYRTDNVLSFDLDMSERTTADYENNVNPTVRAALSAALQDDEQLEVVAQENLPSMGFSNPDLQFSSLSGSGRLQTGGGKAAAKPRRKKSIISKARLTIEPAPSGSFLPYCDDLVPCIFRLVSSSPLVRNMLAHLTSCLVRQPLPRLKRSPNPAV